MKELKNLKLNNKSLEEFDKLMNYHLDKIEELEINEININPKLYNLIGLCINLKQLIVKGDLRTDINKIVYNISNPDKIETLILESVKLPTNKVMSNFINLSTISLTNINFSNLSKFFEIIPNPEKVIALNLTNIDFGKKAISICSIFKNLKYLNLDNLKNCIFDNFDFIYENKSIFRFEFCNNEIDFASINSLTKGIYNKKIELGIKTQEDCEIQNSLEINNNEISITINSYDLDKLIDSVSFYKLTNLFIILGENIDIGQYIKKFKKVKEKVSIAVKDISYFNIENTRKFQDRLNLKFVNVLENPKNLKLTDNIQCYTIEEYIKIREEFEKILNEVVSSHSTNVYKFFDVYEYFKNEIKYVEEDIDLKDVFVNKKSSYNFYSLAINSCLKELGFNSKVIKGRIGEKENLFWNQINLNNNWYNFDIAYELTQKNHKLFKKLFKIDLLNDEQFYETHTPYFDSNPEKCYGDFQTLKKEIKKEEKENKPKLWKNIYQKIISIFKFNKNKALPEPDENEK